MSDIQGKFKKARILTRTIDGIIVKIHEYRTMLTMGSNGANPDRVQTTPNQDKMGTYASMIVDLEKEANVLADELADIKEELSSYVNQLNDFLYELVVDYYFKGKGLKEIGDKLGRDRYELRKIAMKTIYRLEKGLNTQDIV